MASEKMRINHYPTDLDIPSKHRELARRLIDEEFPKPLELISRSSSVLSVGSCFAVEISRILGKKGFDTFGVCMEEAENTTFATNLLLHTDDDEVLKHLTNHDPVTVKTLQERIDVCDCAIITIGQAQLMVGLDGLYAPYRSMSFSQKKAVQSIMTMPEQNVGNVLSIINQIRRFNTDAKIILTVSPIPLNRAFLPNSSAFVQDCISKSCMRIVAAQIMSKNLPGVYYWPSFEMVRWLSAHTGPVFGADNGLGTRHVNDEIIETIAELFIEKFTF